MEINYAHHLRVERSVSRERILTHLPKDWNIFAIKATEEKIDFGRDDIHQEYIFDSPLFSHEFSDEEIQKEQDWLEESFYLILQYNHAWHRPYNHNQGELRKNYEKIAGLVRYYRDFYTQNKIDFLVMDIDCRVTSVLATLIAKKTGVKIIVLGHGRVPGTFMLRKPDFNPIFWKKLTDEDIEVSKKFFQEKYTKKKNEERRHIYCRNRGAYSVNLEKIADNSKKLYNKIIPDEKTKRINKIQKIPVSKTINDQLSRQMRKIFVPGMFEEPDMESRFLFFPLHYDRESMLSWGEHFLNQYDIMQKVSEALPLGTYLYLKSHPNWLSVDAPISEMKKLKNNKNVKIIPPLTDPFELIKNCTAVVTINSTSGMEAMPFGKPVITFGHSFYAKEGVALCVHDLKTLPKAIETVIYHPEKSFEQEKRDLLLAEYYKHLIPFEGTSVDPDPEKGDINGKRIAEELVRYIEHLRAY